MSKERIEIGDKVRWKEWGPNSFFTLPYYNVSAVRYETGTGVDIKLLEKNDNCYWTHLYNDKDSNFEFVEEAVLKVITPPVKKNEGWGFE